VKPLNEHSLEALQVQAGACSWFYHMTLGDLTSFLAWLQGHIHNELDLHRQVLYTQLDCLTLGGKDGSYFVIQVANRSKSPGLECTMNWG
jgi:hypothetical protein